MQSIITPTLEPGSAVVHPRHGAGVVVGHQRRTVAGELRDYVEIDVEHSHMRVLVPEDAVELVGLRSVIDDRMLSRVVEVLGDEPNLVPDAWSARSKSYRHRLAGGDVLELAALVRDLEARSSRRGGLSSLERSLLQGCRGQLVSELAVAMSMPVSDAEAHLDSLVAMPTPREHSQAS